MSLETKDLTCRELVELVTEYLEETLPAAERVRFDEHLKTCPHCRTYLEQMRRTVRVVGGLSQEAFPAGALEVLLEHFRRWRG